MAISKHLKITFFKKALEEVKCLEKENSFTAITKEIGGILRYTGRILSSDQVAIIGTLTNTMQISTDLSVSTFSVFLFLTSIQDFNWDKAFKDGPSKICGRQPLKNLEGYGLLRKIISHQTF